MNKLKEQAKIAILQKMRGKHGKKQFLNWEKKPIY